MHYRDHGQLRANVSRYAALRCQRKIKNMVPRDIRDTYPPFKVIHPISSRSNLRKIRAAYEPWCGIFLRKKTVEQENHVEANEHSEITPILSDPDKTE